MILELIIGGLVYRAVTGRSPIDLLALWDAARPVLRSWLGRHDGWRAARVLAKVVLVIDRTAVGARHLAALCRLTALDNEGKLLGETYDEVPLAGATAASAVKAGDEVELTPLLA